MTVKLIRIEDNRNLLLSVGETECMDVGPKLFHGELQIEQTPKKAEFSIAYQLFNPIALDSE